MYKKQLISILSLVLLMGVLSVSSPQTAQAFQMPDRIIRALDTQNNLPSSRQGAWVDSVIFSEQTSAESAVTQLKNNELDIYAYSISDPILFQTVQADPSLAYTLSYGSYNELTFNPYGPYFNDGRINPFYNSKIREAVNWLIDRDYITQSIYAGMAQAKFFPIINGFPDYLRYANTCSDLEAYYAYDPSKAAQVIATEMLGMGAVLVDGKWNYNGEPITLIFIIRVEDKRLQMGDYMADQLESIGFTVERLHLTRAEASPIWVQGDPAEGLFHIYTGGWITTAVWRDDGSTFSFFYTPRDYPIPLWQTYAPSPEFDEITLKLRNNDFVSMEERGQLFTQALGLALNDSGSGSVRDWLVDQTIFSPRRADTTVAYDLAGGIAGTQLWPYVVRFSGQVGGEMRIAQPGILVEPWNPIGGSNWIYDSMPIRATQDYAIVSDPYTGLTWSQRAERAEVIATQGLPITKTLDWVDLTFTPEITVPTDAWVDWDAANQRFITAGEKFTQTITAKIKSTVFYPANLFDTVNWHDGSPLDLSDFITRMIMTFDPGKPESAIFDEAQAETLAAFMSHFKGVRIVSTDPLVIETYEDYYALDAELNVVSWWPNYTYGPAAWHNLAIGVRADADQVLAFSAAKADLLGIEWMSFIAGASLPILADYMDDSSVENFIPYLPTLGLYVTSAEATARWANLQAWYSSHGNFWLGNGPFYLDQVDTINRTLQLQRFTDFPDLAGKWDRFGVSKTPVLTLNYSSGAPGSFFNVTGYGFPANALATITVNGQTIGQEWVDINDKIEITLNTQEADSGIYIVVISVNPSGTIRFILDASQPIREQEGSNIIFDVPPGIAFTSELFLPIVKR